MLFKMQINIHSLIFINKPNKQLRRARNELISARFIFNAGLSNNENMAVRK